MIGHETKAHNQYNYKLQLYMTMTKREQKKIVHEGSPVFGKKKTTSLTCWFLKETNPKSLEPPVFRSHITLASLNHELLNSIRLYYSTAHGFKPTSRWSDAEKGINPARPNDSCLTRDVKLLRNVIRSLQTNRF